MARVEKSIIIARPIKEVFAYVADQTNAPQWQAGLVECVCQSDVAHFDPQNWPTSRIHLT